MITLDELRPAGASSVLFESIAGSRAYGTSTTASDEDIRGIFAVPQLPEFEGRNCYKARSGPPLPRLLIRWWP
jgi:RNA repair pathway DNA polymerase beta family